MINSKLQILFYTTFISFYFVNSNWAQSPVQNIRSVITGLDSDRVIKEANLYLKETPITITSFPADRSFGGKHDYYSEGDYWWPNPSDPEAPYIRKDGLSNPNNFNSHRQALINFSIQVPTLIAAYIFTKDNVYVEHALKHLNAWFVNNQTRMNPNLRYAQAIKGITSGRGIGIIDTIHLIEIVQAIIVLEKLNLISEEELTAVKDWFSKYNEWLFTDQFGIDERDNGNNHSTCWNMQVAQYAKFTNDLEKMEYCSNHFKNDLLPKQMAQNGSFPLELERTKPYGYSLFNLDAMVMVVKILSVNENLWNFYTNGNKNIRNAMEFMYPFILDKQSWPYTKDVMYYDYWPVRQPSLLFAGLALIDEKYISLWMTLDPAPKVDEVIRNYFIRQPILWIDD